MNLICYFKGHKLEHIFNLKDIQGGRALWQCTRCKLVHIDATYEFYAKREKKSPTI